MKRIVKISLIIGFISIAVHPLQAGAIWPYTEFSRVKICLYNLNSELHGKHDPVQNGEIIPSVRKEGFEFNASQITAFKKWLKQDLSLLQEGLSKCYIPHHALFLYNEKDSLVGRMSVCFLCQGVYFYGPKRPIRKTSYSSKTEQRAIKQLEDLKDLVLAAHVPVYKTAEEYELLTVEVPKEYNMFDSSFIQKYFPPVEYSRLKREAEFICNPVLNSKNYFKTTAGGDKYFFAEFNCLNSEFKFSGRAESNLVLDQAILRNKEIDICGGLVCGMTQFDFFKLITFDGHVYPRILLITDGNSKAMRFSFENDRIVSIEIINKIP